MHEKQLIERIFHEHYSPLCNYAAKILGDFDQAEEVVQGLFVELLEKGALAGVNNPERFLLRSTKFKCIDYLRKTRSLLSALEPLSSEPMPIQEAGYETEEELEALFHYFIARLPPKTREVFLLVRKSGLSYREVADELGISEKTVENQMSRALKKMRTLLKDYGYLSSLYFGNFSNFF